MLTILFTDFCAGVGQFFFFVLALTLVSFASIAQIFMVSAFFEVFNVANALNILLLTVSTVRHTDTKMTLFSICIYIYSVLVGLL